MNVLFVSSLWPPSVLGGAELYAARLAVELQARGHETAAVTQGVEGDGVIAAVTPWPYRLDAYGAQPAWKRGILHARDLYDPMSGAVVRKAIERFDADVVHSHSIAGLSTAALTAPATAGRAHVHHLHDYWLLCQRSNFSRRDGSNCDRRCAGCVAFSRVRNTLASRHGPDRLIAPSQYVARTHEHLEWTRGRIRTLHLPAEEVEPAVRHRAAGDPVTFGYLGQLTANKGVRTLLAAFAEIGPSGARLLVGGRGALSGEVHGEGVTALGWLDDAGRDDFWRSIDCLVVPSEWAEPGGTVAVEARARRLPVIAANAGGMVEAVEDMSRPLIFEPGDRRGLADSLRRFAAEPSRYAPSPSSTWPTWATHVVEVERVYEEAIAARRA